MQPRAAQVAHNAASQAPHCSLHAHHWEHWLVFFCWPWELYSPYLLFIIVSKVHLVSGLFSGKIAFPPPLHGGTSKLLPDEGGGWYLLKALRRRTEAWPTFAGGWWYLGQERLRADRASRPRALVGRSLGPWSVLEVETETSGYLHSQVTWMRNGLEGHVTGIKANTKESIYYPGRKFVLLDSVAADIMISFPSVEGD